MRWLCSSLIFCIALLIFQNIAFAQEDIPQELLDLKAQLIEQVPKESLEKCQETLVPLYDIETMTFLMFLDTTFQNKSSTSSLVNIAIARYAEYKKAIRSYYKKLSPEYTVDEGAQVFKDQFNVYSLCGTISDSYLDLAKQHMIEHIKNNVATKKTTMLLEKYQSINDKLRDLNMEIAEMYSFFVTFKNKLPFFVENCQ
jgi:hypothetical protein